MPSHEAKLLADFLIAPASLRDFMTPRQFASIFPSAHQSNPVIKELYNEIYALRERDIQVVRQDIADEVKRSKQLKREYAKERRRMDDANVSGINPIALQMEEEVRTCRLQARTSLSSNSLFPAFRRPGQKTAHAADCSRQHHRSMRIPRIAN
jgi:hypothetical protein